MAFPAVYFLTQQKITQTQKGLLQNFKDKLIELSFTTGKMSISYSSEKRGWILLALAEVLSIVDEHYKTELTANVIAIIPPQPVESYKDLLGKGTSTSNYFIEFDEILTTDRLLDYHIKLESHHQYIQINISVINSFGGNKFRLESLKTGAVRPLGSFDWLRPMHLQMTRSQLTSHWCSLTRKSQFLGYRMNIFGGAIGLDMTSTSNTLNTSGITKLWNDLDLADRCRRLGMLKRKTEEFETEKSEDFLQVNHLVPFFVFWLMIKAVVVILFVLEARFLVKFIWDCVLDNFKRIIRDRLFTA